MKDFSSIENFVDFFEKVILTVHHAQRDGLERAAEVLETEAKSEIGTYQDAAGPFPAWEPLSHATLYGGVSPEGHPFKGKIELGYSPPDNPLLREGGLRDHITHEADSTDAAVGVKSETVSTPYGPPVDIGDVAVWQELGTERMPPRSFLGHAAVVKGDEAVQEVAAAVVTHISNTLYKHYLGDDERGD